MPEELERRLRRQVANKNWPQERKDAYVYGTMRKTGWEPSNQIGVKARNKLRKGK